MENILTFNLHQATVPLSNYKAEQRDEISKKIEEWNGQKPAIRVKAEEQVELVGEDGKEPEGQTVSWTESQRSEEGREITAVRVRCTKAYVTELRLDYQTRGEDYQGGIWRQTAHNPDGKQGEEKVLDLKKGEKVVGVRARSCRRDGSLTVLEVTTNQGNSVRWGAKWEEKNDQKRFSVTRGHLLYCSGQTRGGLYSLTFHWQLQQPDSDPRKWKEPTTTTSYQLLEPRVGQEEVEKDVNDRVKKMAMDNEEIDDDEELKQIDGKVETNVYYGVEKRSLLEFMSYFQHNHGLDKDSKVWTETEASLKMMDFTKSIENTSNSTDQDKTTHLTYTSKLHKDGKIDLSCAICRCKYQKYKGCASKMDTIIPNILQKMATKALQNSD